MSEEVIPRFTMTEEAKEELQKQIQQWFDSVFKEKYVIIECPYALALEYGTTPAKSSSRSTAQTTKDPETGQVITKTRLQFRDWIAKKESLSGKERVKKGDMIYRKVMEEGMRPHPYIRPAVEDMCHLRLEDIKSQSQAPPEAGDITSQYAYFLMARMRYYLRNNKNDVSDKLASSIKVAPMMMAEMAGAVREVDLGEGKYHWKPGQARR